MALANVLALTPAGIAGSRGRGYLTLRFWNAEVFGEFESVVETIYARCSERLPADHRIKDPLPGPPPQGGREPRQAVKVTV